MAVIQRENPENVLLPLPAYLEAYRNRVNNFGLYFQKFFKYHQNGDKLETQQSWSNGQRGRNREDYEWSLVHNQFKRSTMMQSFSGMLSRIHKKQRYCVQGMHRLGAGILEITAESLTPFLTGIGETTPTEVGMVFDRNTGMPFMPAASVKGAVRYAYCVNFALNNPGRVDQGTLNENDVDGLVRLFGSTDTSEGTRGGFAFMDAYTDSVPELKLDIMNPHHGKYYRGESAAGPVETEAPVPIKFLTVKKEGIFRFRGFFLTKEAEKYRNELVEAFRTAMTEMGLGAKTAAGYGRFKDVLDTTLELLETAEAEKARRADKERTEKEKKEAEEQAKIEKEEKKRRAAQREALKKEREAEEKKQEELYEQALQSAQGIDLAILQLQKGDEKMALEMFDKFLKTLKSLDDRERELALLIKKKFAKMNKKAKKSKLQRKQQVEILLRG